MSRFIFWLLSCSPDTASNMPRFSEVDITVSFGSTAKVYRIEQACSKEEVALGLRYRKLKASEGVLLCVKTGFISMKKMKSPISVAFLSKTKEVFHLVDLELDSRNYPIPSGTELVWEMPLHWFDTNGIDKGTRILSISQP